MHEVRDGSELTITVLGSVSLSRCPPSLPSVCLSVCPYESLVRLIGVGLARLSNSAVNRLLVLQTAERLAEIAHALQADWRARRKRTREGAEQASEVTWSRLELARRH